MCDGGGGVDNELPDVESPADEGSADRPKIDIQIRKRKEQPVRISDLEDRDLKITIIAEKGRIRFEYRLRRTSKKIKEYGETLWSRIWRLVSSFW